MKSFKKIKTLGDGRAMLNIGCGAHTHAEWNNVDFSPYARLGGRPLVVKCLRAIGVLSSHRYESLRRIDPDIHHWDLRKGIPYGDGLFDVVYESHFLTHVYRDEAEMLARESWRVLKPGGVARFVLPDLERIVAQYNEAIEAFEKNDPRAEALHEAVTDELFELMTRRRAFGTQKQTGPVRAIERLIRGDTARSGELRRWHYDRFSLGAMMRAAGFEEVRRVDPDESRIEGFNDFLLDLNADGSVYKPESFFMEGVKPRDER